MVIEDKATLGVFAPLKELLTVKELAKELSVHPDTIRRWEKKGRITGIRHPFNNYRLFSLSDLIEELLRNEGKSSWLRARIFERARERGLLNSRPKGSFK